VPLLLEANLADPQMLHIEQRIKYEYCNVHITSGVPKGICRRIK
jgi:hypothetical protein